MFSPAIMACVSQSVAAVVDPCSGAFTDGDTEGFEHASDGSFCTTGWTESDASGKITTNSTTQKRSGSASCKFVNDTDNMFAQADLGAGDASFKITFSIYIPTITQYDAMYFLKVKNTAGDDYLNLMVRYGDTNTEIYFEGGADKLVIPATNEWYDMAAYFATSGTCKMSGTRVSNSTALSDGTDGVVTGTGGAVNARYLRFSTTSIGGEIHYIDAVTYIPGATDL